MFVELMANVWALADLHLSFGVSNKEMHVFGEKWRDHFSKIQCQWQDKIHSDDLILIAGDISWGNRLEEALPDLEWIDSLPGKKVMIRGNHDHWWSAINKLRKVLPSSIHALQNDCFNWNGLSIGGSRLWDDYNLDFDEYVEFIKVDCVKLTETDYDLENAEKIYARELLRLENSLRCLDQNAIARIVMTHYPPIGPRLESSRASVLLEKYKVDCCVFGHIHNLKHVTEPLFGKKNGIQYIMTAADYLDFNPIKIYSI